jgi:tripartite-type tricarboxylate transporter receptor subunit TctC
MQWLIMQWFVRQWFVRQWQKRPVLELGLFVLCVWIPTPMVSGQTKFGAKIADVVAAAKKKPGPSYGSIGSGSLGHVAMALLGRNNGLDFQHIPYKGGGPLMNDALAGHVPLAVPKS